jgi:hypothetical protein
VIARFEGGGGVREGISMPGAYNGDKQLVF